MSPYGVTITVSDGVVTTSETIAIAVLNVAPTATLQNNGPKTYGETVTISFTGA